MFFIQEELEKGDEIARCPSCSLIIKVIYNLVSLFCTTRAFLRASLSTG